MSVGSGSRDHAGRRRKHRAVTGAAARGIPHCGRLREFAGSIRGSAGAGQFYGLATIRPFGRRCTVAGGFFGPHPVGQSSVCILFPSGLDPGSTLGDVHHGLLRHWSCLFSHPDDQIQLGNDFGIDPLSGNKLRKNVIFGLLHEISKS